MTRDETLQLYCKEREYQESIFGRYENQPTLNIASFLEFIEQYLKEAKEAYTGVWTPTLPNWLESCNETQYQLSAPVETYENLIKVFALSGAALEAYTQINSEQWREEGIKKKWKK